jgi:nickel-dependent lactate racemase
VEMTFRYPNIGGVQIPDRNLIGHYQAKRVPGAPPAESIVTHALEHPIGAARLAEAVEPRHAVLLLVDDHTRRTPLSRILPGVVAELAMAGVPDGSIRILICGSTHRPMTPEEKLAKLGAEIVERFEIIDRDDRDPRQLSDLGKLEDGTPVIVDRRITDSDYVIGIGHIVPHRTYGFSGGAKIVLPGAAGRESTDFMHWHSVRYHTAELFCTVRNAMRAMANAFAERAGLKYLVDVIQDDDGRIVGAVAGDPVEAHEKGCELSRDIYWVEVPEPADICITDSFPADVDLWQAAKGIYAMEFVLKEDGVVILVTPAPEGVAQGHPKVEEVGFQPQPRIEEEVHAGRLPKSAGAAMLVYAGRVVADKGRGILVSPGIGPDMAKPLHLAFADSAKEALQMAFDIKGKSASVLAFNHGGEILPFVKGQCVV